MHTLVDLFTGISASIKRALCRAGTFGLDPTRAPAPGMAVLLLVECGSQGLPGPTAHCVAKKYFAKAALCPSLYHSEIIAVISKWFVLLMSGLKFHIWQVPRINSVSG